MKSLRLQRTSQQNKALWLFFQILSDSLNLAGLDMRVVLKPSVEISWTKQNIHNYLWVPIQQEKFGKKSTKDLTTKEVQEVYEEVNRFMSGFGLHIPFPSIEELLNQQRNEDT